MHLPCRSRLRSLVCTVLFSSTLLFAQTPPSPPTINGFSPSTISIGMPVTITGTNFVSNNTTVRFGNATATSTTVQSSTQLTAVVPTSLANAPGNITITSSGGNATSPTNYTVNLTPIINSFTPTTAPVNRMVTVSGYNFLGSAIANRTISVNGANVTTSLTAGAGNQITFPIPASATTGPITISTNQGVAVSAANIVIGSGPAPANDSFATPTVIAGATGNVTATNTYATKEPGEANHGGNAGGASIWFSWTAPASRWYLFNPNQTTTTNFGVLQSISTGTDLASATVIASASSNSTFPRYNSAVPLNATAGTTYRIALDGFNGVMGDVRLNWSELNAPQIASFAPSTPPTVFAGQIGNITVGGSGFTPGATASIGGVTVPPARVSVATPTTLSITQVPLTAALGASPVTITTPVGAAVSPTTLEIIAPPAPTITTFSPASGNIGANVTITGTALALADSPVSVFFNGVPATSITTTSSNTVSARVPTGASTGPITISTIAGNTTSTANFTVTSAIPPPVVTGFAPASGPVGTAVSISGDNLTTVTSVTFNGVSANFTVTSPNSLITTVPASATSGLISVSNGATTTSSPAPFVVTPAPTIESLSITNVTPTMLVVITGTNLNNVQSVQFGGIGAQFTSDSSTKITARTPFGISGSGFVTVTTADGTAISPVPYTVLPPAVPNIAAFAPSVVAVGQSVSISGSGFSDVVAVLFNNVPASAFTVHSPTSLSASAPTNLTAGVITVVTSIGSSTSAPYTISSAPIITGITPSSGPIGRIITVNGSNFSGPGISNQVLLVNGTPIGGFSRGTGTWTFAVPAGATTGPITIQTSQGFATSPIPFTVATGPAPANDAFASPLALTGTSGVQFGNTTNATKEPGEPNHANNPGGASVWFTWTAPSSGLYLFNPSNSTSSQMGIIQSIYTGDTLGSLVRIATGQTPTGVSIRYASAAVLNAVAGTTYRIALDGFNGVMADYRLSWSPLGPPTISGFNPTNGLANQTSPTISITGNNFPPGSTVMFNGAPVAANRLTYQNPNLITVTQIPADATTGPITVTTPAGSVSSAGSFIIGSPTPTISGFSPSGARVGTPVSINGSNFAGTTAVLFNGTATANFTVTGNNTLITTSVPEGSSTGPITVVTPNGSAVSTTPFVVVVLPEITQQPQSQTVPAFSNVTFSVTATSNGPEEYYWTKNGVAIFGSDSRILTLSNVTAVDAGAYAAVVVNNAGSVTSSPAVLTVTKVAATVTLGDLATTYDGAPKPASASTSPGGLAVTISYDGSPNAPINAGTYAVSASISDLNYAGTATGFLHIAKATAALEFANLTHTYDGFPKTANVTTTPPNLATSISYPGGVLPVDAGSYALTATVVDPNYMGIRAALMTINPAVATITLAGLDQRYDGTPRVVTASTTPSGLPVTIIYNGTGIAPTYPGGYAINASVDHPNYTGAASGTLSIGTTAFVRHAPTLNGDLFGSIQVTSPESVTLNGAALVSGDLLIPGTPTVRVNGHATYASTIDASGDVAPADHLITLSGNAVLRHVVRRINALALPVVTPPAPALGTVDVLLSSAPPAIDYSTVRDLTLDVNGSTLAVAPGAYRHFTVNNGNTLILGNTGATVPDRYDLQQLTLNGNSRIRLAGPVILTVANAINSNGTINDDAPASWLTLQVASGGLTLNSNATLSGQVVAPNGTVTLNSATLEGSVTSDQLIINNNATLADPVD